MPIKVRGKKFQVTVHSKGKRYRRQFPSIKDAQNWELQTLTDLATGKNPPDTPKFDPPQSSLRLPTTLKEGFDYTYKTSWIDIESGKEMRRNGDMILKCLGKDVPLVSVDKFCIDGIVSCLRDHGNKNGTINRKLTALSKVLKIAEELGVINKKPKIPFLKEETHRVRWYTDEELEQMISYCNNIGSPSYWFGVFAHYLGFMADTGLRQGEAFALRWEDLRWDDAIYISNSKNGLPRAVPLTKRALKAINFMKQNFQGPDVTQEPHDKYHGPWACLHSNLLRKHWAEIRKAMGWEDDPQAVLHALRHTFCSRLVQKGAPLKMVQELAGHKRIEMTLRYAHLSTHDLSTCIELLN